MKNQQFSFSCPVCNSNEYSCLGPYIARSELFKNRELAKCLVCGVVSMHPCTIEGAPADYYEKQYWTDEILARRLPSLRAQAQARCVFMRPAVSFNCQLRVLDVGAGVGYMNWGFRKVWPDAKIDYTAIEVNPAAVKYLTADFGVDRFVSDIDEVHGAFDVIVLSHILEHITEPVEFLSKIRSFLTSPESCLFVEVPNSDFLFKKRNEPHVLFYSPKTLSEVLARNGFKTVLVDTCGQPIWKVRADGGLDCPSSFLTFRKILYNLLVHSNAKFSMYGGDRQWIRALCKTGFNDL